jgi:hypothetical protein
LEKEARLAAKMVKSSSATLSVDKKDKAEKKSPKEQVEFVNHTPKGHKKGACFRDPAANILS